MAPRRTCLQHTMARMFLAVSVTVVGVHAQGYEPDAPNAPVEFTCAYRKFALEYAGHINTNVDRGLVFDALMLGALCNETRPTSPTTKNHRNGVDSNRPDTPTVYVSPTGSDSNPGTSPSSPKKTLDAALVATRMLPAGSKTMQLLPGTFHLDTTLTLTPADSGLLIAGSGNDDVWISGAAPLPDSPKWVPHKVAPAAKGTVKVYSGMNDQSGCTNNANTSKCRCYLEPVLNNCVQAFSECVECTAFAYSGNGSSAMTSQGWKNQCCLRLDNVWNPYPLTDHTCGRRDGAHPAINVWKTVLPEGSGPVEQLRVGEEGVRAPRARHPNGNPETDQWPIGWVLGAAAFLPPKPPKTQPTLVNVSNAEIAARGSTTFSTYGGGINGPCEAFDPPFSYWCQLHPSGGGGFQYFVPGGYQWSPGDLPLNTSDDVSGSGRWTVHMWRRSHWANWMFDVDSVDVATQTIKFGKGGYQGCRGGNGSDWYVENELLFLDTAGEFFYDEATRTLYRAFNSTPPATEAMATPRLQTLLAINGTMTDPVRGVRIEGVGFRDAAPTYMEPHAVPSGGDWALERRAALFAEGTEGLTVANCTFTRLDGNGLMLSRYHRNASILDCHFAWTGGTAIAGWGYTDEISDDGVHGWDGSDGNHPVYTLVEGNVIRETGIWEKQSSCWFQAKTARTTLRRNLCFNLARAGFNFNDGFGGGDLVEHNLIFNSCRESSDHGPINSWDRQPYVTKFGANLGVASGLMAPRNITHNFLVANYGGGNGGVDNDDGSEYYRNNHNFQIYGHQKFKVGNIESFGNVLLWVTDYGGKWSAEGNIPGKPNAMYNNTVVFAPQGTQQYHSVTQPPWIAYDNHLFGENVTLADGRKALTLPEFQALDPAHNDVGSTWSKVTPPPETMVQWGRTLLLGQ